MDRLRVSEQLYVGGFLCLTNGELEIGELQRKDVNKCFLGEF